jgi:hypothetical protein
MFKNIGHFVRRSERLAGYVLRRDASHIHDTSLLTAGEIDVGNSHEKLGKGVLTSTSRHAEYWPVLIH